MPGQRRPILDFRAFRRGEDRRLILIIMAFVVVVGVVAIGLVYGWGTAGTAGICLAVGAVILGLLWLILTLVERWVKED